MHNASNAYPPQTFAEAKGSGADAHYFFASMRAERSLQAHTKVRVSRMRNMTADLWAPAGKKMAKAFKEYECASKNLFTDCGVSCSSSSLLLANYLTFANRDGLQLDDEVAGFWRSLTKTRNM